MRPRPSLWLPLMLLALAVRAGGAQAGGPRPGSPPRGRDSTVAAAPIITRGDLLVLGGGALAAWAAQPSDLRVRDRVRSDRWQRNGTLDAITDAGNAWGQPGVVTAGLLLWGGGRVAGNAGVAATGLRAIEAITVSGVVTKTLKTAFGRTRPRVDPTDDWDVAFGRGWDGDRESFPSGHATVAFAFAAAVTSEVAHRAPRRAPLVGVTTFTLAAGTAYARLHADAHWLSDVTMGAAIGMASGWAVTRWHRTRPGNRLDRLLLGADLAPLVQPGPGATRLGVSLTW